MEKLYPFLYNLSPLKTLKRLAAIAFVCMAAALLPCKLLGQAPTVSYSSPQTFFLNKAGALAPASSNVDAPTGAYNSGVVLGSGLTFSVNDVALDAAGNMYVNDIEATGEVKKISPDGSSTTIIGSGFLGQSADIAVDQNGNVFVADQGLVWEIPASGTPVSYGTPVAISNAFRDPFAIAVDMANNIYVTDLGNHLGGGGAGVYKMAYDGSNKVEIDNGINRPSAVTVDAAGNVYVADDFAEALYEIPANGSPQVQLATGFSFPRGLAVDAAGTIYVDDEGNFGIFAVPAGGGTPVAMVSGLSNLVGVAVDANYNLYGVLQGAGGISKYSPTGGYFISPVTLPAGLSFDNTTGIISGRATAASPATDYLVSAYNANGGASATVNITTANAIVLSYSTPPTFTAGTAITALDPTVTTGTVAAPGYSTTPLSIGSGFNAPGAVAVDAAGNVYVADAGNAAVKKIPAGGGAPISIGSGFVYPTGVAIDAAGDVFVADPSSGLVSEIPVSGSQSTLGSGFVFPSAVAVDQSGNVYVADGSNTLYEIPAGNGTPVILASGFSELTAVAVDQSGNLYVVDGGASIVFELPEKGGIPVSVGGSFLFPTGVAVDAAGIVYVTDFDAGTVYKLSGCGCTEVAVGSGFNQPGGLAVDGAGNIYLADTGDNLVDLISPVGGFFTNIPLPAGLSLDATTGEISGKPKKVSSATNYIITGWDADGPGSATVSLTVVAPPPPAISYATPQTFIAGTAVALNPSNIGGAVAFPAYNDTPLSISSGFSSPFGIATDAAGDIFIAEAGNGVIKEVPIGGGIPVTVASGFDFPTAVAVDAAGDLFIADQGAHAVYEIPFGGSQQTIGSFDAPDGVAVDASGNVYVSDETTNTVYKLPAGSLPPVTVASGYLDLTNLTLDSSGNLYIVDGGGSAVYELLKGGGVVVPVGNFFLYPTAVTVDAMGNIYVADGDAGTIFKLPKGTFAQIPIANGFNEPGGVAVDGAGNVYVGDTYNNAVDEINPAGGYFINTPLPAGLCLDSKTGIISGTPAAVSPASNYTITGYNAGGSSAAVVRITVNLPPAPTLSYSGPQTYTAGTAITPLSPSSTNVDAPAYYSSFITKGPVFSQPQGVAVDTLGNIYVADPFTASVTEIPFDGSTPVSIAPGVFSAPLGVALDAAGNIYVADGGFDPSTAGVYKVPVTLGTPGTPIPLGNPGDFGSPGSIAVDAAGNVYVGDLDYGSVAELPAGGGNTIFFRFIFGYPGGVAVDAAGNVYVSDSGSGASVAVYEITNGGTKRTKTGHGFNLPTGIAVDASGNVFVSDGGVGAIKEIPSGGSPQVTVSGFGIPFGIAADGRGNVYFSDDGDATVKEISPAGGYYIRPVLPAGLSFNSTTGAISGFPTAASPATNYTISAYSYGGSASAGVNIAVNLPPVPVISYHTPNIYNINAAITPLAPASTGGPVGAPAYSGNSVNTGPAFVSPVGVAADAAGNLYVADYTAGAVGLGPTETTITKIPADGSASFTIGSGFNNPSGVAVDAAGNVYVGDTGNNSVEKIPFSGGSYGSPVTLASGFNSPVGVAADAVGNVYVADEGNNAVEVIPFSGGGYGSPVAIGSGFNGPGGVAVDAAGNVYVADTFNGAVEMIPFSGGSYGSPVAIGSHFQAPLGIAVDAGGNVFVADAVKGVFEITAPVTGGGVPVAIGGVFSGPGGVTADGAGNVYVAVGNSTLIKQIKPLGGYYVGPFLPAGLSFDEVTGIVSGTPTAFSPATNYTVTAYNYGGGGPATVSIETASTNASLSALTIGNGTLSPAFATGTTSYNVAEPNGVAITVVRPTASDANATITVDGTAVTSGVVSGAIPLSVGSTPISVVVTAQDGVTKKTYTITANRAQSGNANLSSLTLSTGSLTPAFAPGTTTYAVFENNTVTSITLKPATTSILATVKVNGTTVPSGTSSASIPLSIGPNTIQVVVKAQDGTSQTYTITAWRKGTSTNADLSALTIGNGTLSPAFAAATTGYTVSEPNSVALVVVRPTASDPVATITINGTAVASGVISGQIPLSVGSTNTILVVVTAADEVTTKTYTITATRAPSSNASLSALTISTGTLSPGFATGPIAYSVSESSGTASVTIKPTTTSIVATVKVNGITVTSGTSSGSISLPPGTTNIPVEVTAQDGTTKKTYTIAVTRGSGGSNAFIPLAAGTGISVTKPIETPALAEDGIAVHQGLSPNGDGINDFLQIDNISQYPDNKLSIMNRNGQLIYEAKGYDNSSKVFDGHSNKNGQLQLPGTYFYQLDYTVNGIIKHKTGFLVLKY